MKISEVKTNNRALALAERLTQGASSLANYAQNLSDSEWGIPVAGDGRSIGVVIHHVAHVYPTEIKLAQVLASGEAITGATMEVINQMNAEHAKEFTSVSKTETLELLKHNSQVAAKSIEQFTNEELESSAPVSLYAEAPLTAQFFIEDHALRHSYHHLAKIKETLEMN